MARRFRFALRGLFCVMLVACREPSHAAESKPVAAEVAKVTELIYSGKLHNGWLDYGWSPREIDRGPAKVDLSNYGGWILGKPGKKQGYGGLRFKVRTVDAVDLEIRVEGHGSFPKVALVNFEPIAEANGWREYFLPMPMLNPRGVDFEQ
ncbi:MAG: glycosyl hydrolase, partial [Myxococcaceae bacterium]|nr:glycosyl hydrolase [Myxococcaceae bacterium]